MKLNKILVSSNGATLNLRSNRGVMNGIAVYPPIPGKPVSTVLTECGKLVEMSGARINGVGVSKYLKELGFIEAQPGCEAAAKIADYLDVKEGLKYVEDASQTQTDRLQQELAGKKCTFVPFNPEEAIRTVSVKAPSNYRTYVLEIGARFTSGALQVVQEDSPLSDSLKFSDGWIVDEATDVTALPTSSEYGGIVEQAVYVICNVGLGKLVGNKHLVMDADAPESEPMLKGKMLIELTSGDTLVVGIDALDELLVHYVRNGEIIYARSGLTEVHLGGAIGSIAAVIVRVNELDAANSKPKRLKKAA